MYAEIAASLHIPVFAARNRERLALQVRRCAEFAIQDVIQGANEALTLASTAIVIAAEREEMDAALESVGAMHDRTTGVTVCVLRSLLDSAPGADSDLVRETFAQMSWCVGHTAALRLRLVE